MKREMQVRMLVEIKDSRRRLKKVEHYTTPNFYPYLIHDMISNQRIWERVLEIEVREIEVDRKGDWKVI